MLNKRLKLIILFWTCCIFIYSTSQANVLDVMGQSVLSARTYGLGKANVASAGHLDSLFINPAGLAGIKAPAFYGYNQNSFDDLTKSMLSVAYPTSFGIFGLGYLGDTLAGINIADSTGRIVDSISYSQSLLTLGYALPLLENNLYFGSALKYYLTDLDGGMYSANGYDLDLGIIYKIQPNFRLGISYQNILGGVLNTGGLNWSTGSQEYFIGVLKIGLACKVNLWDHPLAIFTSWDSFPQSNIPSYISLGLEQEICSNLVWRCGINNNNYSLDRQKTLNDLYLGLGLNFANTQIDYTYSVNIPDERGNRHLISLGIAFDAPAINIPTYGRPDESHNMGDKNIINDFGDF